MRISCKSCDQRIFQRTIRFMFKKPDKKPIFTGPCDQGGKCLNVCYGKWFDSIFNMYYPHVFTNIFFHVSLGKGICHVHSIIEKCVNRAEERDSFFLETRTDISDLLSQSKFVRKSLSSHYTNEEDAVFNLLRRASEVPGDDDYESFIATAIKAQECGRDKSYK